MKQKVSMTIMSHLSDAQEAIGTMNGMAKSNINFAKYLVLKYSDTDQEHNPEHDHELFVEKYPQLQG